MESRYKVVISGRNLHKELELTSENPQVRVGTDISHDVRLRKELFFEPVELVFSCRDGQWSVECGDNLYISTGDIRKLTGTKLRHGDSVEVRYFESDYPLFRVDFLIDFDDGKRRYNLPVSIAGKNRLNIGADPRCDIVLGSPYAAAEAVVLEKAASGYHLKPLRSQYGVYINGSRITGPAVVENGDFFQIADHFFYLKDEILWTELREDLQLKGLECLDCPPLGNYPRFLRSTRVKTALNGESIEVLGPGAPIQKPKDNIFTRLLPSLGMLLASGVMAFLGGTMIIFSVISGVMAIVTTVLNFRQSRKDYEQAAAERIRVYSDYIDRKRQEIAKARAEEWEALEQRYIGPETELSRLQSFSTDLFDRAKEDEDFLCVRLGSGNVEAARALKYRKQESLDTGDALQMIPQQLSEEFRCLADAPVTVDLKRANAVGICGPEESRYQIMHNMVVDLAARQYHSDVKFVFVAEPANRDRIHWLRLLPHVYNDSLETRNIICNEESRDLIFEYLYKELTAREEARHYDHRIVVFFCDQYGFRSHPISRYLHKAAALGVSLIFFGSARADIPMGCGYLVELDGQSGGRLTDTADDSRSRNFTYRPISAGDCRRVVEILAPVYTQEVSLESDLTKDISLFELLNILAVDDLDLTERWSNSQVFRSLAAPIGVSKSGTVCLDLHDKAHGPHGLVAGTTGSGKSELLQTYVLAMSTLYSPAEVGFVIIDFKGGGMANQFRDLPHLMGTITNIDGKQISRSLRSIKAELRKRQRYFAEAEVNHIDRYIRKYRAGEVSEPLPHLIIIVDEFAELKAEQPEFMKELISAARIGRSLGVHLILATQKPSGQVNEQIWSNSRFKICLKVQSQQDSNEVLKSPLASEIREPGRAYLQVGSNEVFELLQSAYSGAPEKEEDAAVREFTIYQLNDSGKRVPVYSQSRKRSEDTATQLAAIVRHVSSHCREQGIPRLPQICQPALPEQLPFRAVRPGEGVGIGLGIYDDPDNQQQSEIFVDFTQTNVAVIGSSRTGKTNVLQTMVRSLASQYSPEEVNVYIADFGSMVMKNFEELKHVGGVVTVNETERVKNLFKLLSEEITRRKQLFIRAGVSAYPSYLEAGHRDLPQILLMIDNLGLLRELYFGDQDMLLPILREGLAVGISVVATGTQTAGVGYKYLSNFGCRLALTCNDPVDYGVLLSNGRLRPDNVPGRCLLEIDREVMEGQIYLAFEGEKEIRRVENICAFVETVNGRYPDVRVVPIPDIPEFVTKEYIRKHYGEPSVGSWTVGLDYATVRPAAVDLSAVTTLGIVGGDREEQQNAVAGLMESLGCAEAEVYIADDLHGTLRAYRGAAADYGRLPEEYPGLIHKLHELARQRYQRSAAEEGWLEKQPLAVLMAQGQEFVSSVSADPAVLEEFRRTFTKYKGMKICFMLTGMENARIPLAGAEVLRLVKENGNLLVLEPLNGLKVLDVSLATVRRFRGERLPGDAFLFRSGVPGKVKVLHATRSVNAENTD